MDKRQKIIEAAVRLFEQNGFWNTSTASISKEAGVAAGTLFRYFATKEALIDELFLELKQEMADFMYQRTVPDAGVEDTLKHIWESYIQWNIENPEKFSILEQLEVASRISSVVKNQVVDMNQFTVKIFKKGKKEGLIAQYPILFLANFMGSSSNNVIRQLLDNQEKRSSKALIKIGFEAFWKGISA